MSDREPERGVAVRNPQKDDMPGELWMLWHGSGFVRSVDDARGGETFLVSRTKAAAAAAAGHQRETYDVHCIPVRVL
jgi:hypothetical protein